MKYIIALSCILGATSASAVEPITGSIGYDTPARPLMLAPVGSTFSHRFTDPLGRDVQEVYKLDTDRTPMLVRRQLRSLN